MAYNLVRRKEDNVVEWFGHGYTWVDKDNGGEGVQIFLEKYLEGDSTLGMKLKPLWF